MAETITWISAREELPDADLTVNVATEGCDEPTWLGYYDGAGQWYDTDANPINVTHWAEMLKGPNHSADEGHQPMKALPDLPFQHRSFPNYTDNQRRYIRIGWNGVLKILRERVTLAGADVNASRGGEQG
jgi:hypothetical protein